MIPKNSDVILMETRQIPSKTFGIAGDRLTEYIDNIEAVKQAILIILDINRFEYPILSWNFGNEMRRIIGEPMEYAMIKTEQYIKEALTQDDRIKDVVDFEFEVARHKLLANYRVVTVFGDFNNETEVNI